MPRSPTLTSESVGMRMFSGLRSRWRIPLLCRYVKASPTWRRIDRAWPTGIGLPAFMNLSQVSALDVLGHQERQAGFGRRAEIEDREDVGVRDARQQFRLAVEAGPAWLGILARGDRQDLHADEPIQGVLPGQVNLAHPAFIERPQDLAAGDRRSVRAGGSMRDRHGIPLNRLNPSRGSPGTALRESSPRRESERMMWNEPQI